MGNTLSEPPPKPVSIYDLQNRVSYFQYCLRSGEFKLTDLIDSAKEYKQNSKHGSYENRFVELGKAATVLLEIIPAHPDYYELTNDEREELRLVSSFFIIKIFLIETFQKKTPPIFDLQKGQKLHDKYTSREYGSLGLDIIKHELEWNANLDNYHKRLEAIELPVSWEGPDDEEHVQLKSLSLEDEHFCASTSITRRSTNH